MPRVIACPETDSITLEELVDHMHSERVDTSDLDQMANAAPWLKRLGNNRSFLVEQVVKELKSHDTMQEGNSYGPQVFMLHSAHRRGRNFFVRACFWPSADERIMQVSGESQFTYHQPHDHNFNFLTVGYLGPGYWSNYYEVDHARVVGYAGEPVELRFVEKSNLAQGKVMLYRACVDVHDQLPADSFSVSINVMESSDRVRRLDQFGYDIARSRIESVANRVTAESLFDVLAFHGMPEHRDLLEDIGRRHASARVRCCAWLSLSNAQHDEDAAIEVLGRVAFDAPRLVRDWARSRIALVGAAAAAADQRQNGMR